MQNTRFEELKTATEAGNVEALYKLGHYYLFDDTIEKDPVEATKCFMKAADMGYCKAQTALADSYIQGRGVEKKPERAIELYILASKQNDITAQYKLANCYRDGIGTEQSFSDTAFWYTTAVLNENQDHELYKRLSASELGNLYFYGRGVEQNYEQALHFYGIASPDEKNPNADYHIGLCYLNGYGVEKNTFFAAFHFASAARCDHKEAKAYLDMLDETYDMGII